jgi:hypothetical protein
MSNLKKLDVTNSPASTLEHSQLQEHLMLKQMMRMMLKQSSQTAQK